MKLHISVFMEVKLLLALSPHLPEELKSQSQDLLSLVGGAT
jgi:hypothetical protein